MYLQIRRKLSTRPKVGKYPPILGSYRIQVRGDDFSGALVFYHHRTGEGGKILFVPGQGQTFFSKECIKTHPADESGHF